MMEKMTSYLNEIIVMPRSRLIAMQGGGLAAVGALLVAGQHGDVITVAGFLVSFIGLAMAAIGVSMVPNRAEDMNARKGTQK